VGSYSTDARARHNVSWARQGGRDANCIFVLFQKSFDVVVRSYMWDRLRAVGFSGPFLDVVLGIYRNSTFWIKVGGRISSGFVVTVGIQARVPSQPNFVYAIH
jgi:hypothetical protein